MTFVGMDAHRNACQMCVLEAADNDHPQRAPERLRRTLGRPTQAPGPGAAGRVTAAQGLLGPEGGP
jgi:hypothetical protein